MKVLCPANFAPCRKKCVGDCPHVEKPEPAKRLIEILFGVK
jgi:hypothetical protein